MTKIANKKEWDFIIKEIRGEEKPSIPIDGDYLFKRHFLLYLQVILGQKDKFEFYQVLKKLYLKMPKYKDGKQISAW